MEHIFSELEYLKVKTVDTPLETLLSEAMFSRNSRVNQHTKLIPLQLVTGQQSVLLPVARSYRETGAIYVFKK